VPFLLLGEIMAYIFIAIMVLVIIGAFKINVILGLIVFLGTVFYFGGGLDSQRQRAKSAATTSKPKPRVAAKRYQGPYFERNLFGGKATLQDAINVAKDGGILGTSLLQRELNIPYAKAVEFLDEMEKQGIIGPQDGSRPRQLLVK
jgi:hypothetical protein